MKVYRFKTASPDRYWCAYLPEGRPDITLGLGRNRLLDGWQPWHVDLERGDGRQFSDFPSLTGGVITVLQKAFSCYQSMLSRLENVEILPCTSDAGALYILNVLNVVDCFDRAKSVYTERRGGKGFIDVAEKYEFRSSVLAGQHIFKFPEAMSQAIFVSDDFVSIARDNDLQGLELRDPIWSSE